jgi:hypothetical protein
MRRIVGAMMCFSCLCLLTEASFPIICQRAICQSEMSFFLGGQWFEPNQNSCFLEATIQFTPIIWANIILLNTNYWCVCYSIFCCCYCFCCRLLPPDEIIRNRSVKTNKSANANHFILKNHVSFMANDRKLKTGYMFHFSNEYVSNFG